MLAANTPPHAERAHHESGTRSIFKKIHLASLRNASRILRATARVAPTVVRVPLRLLI